MTGQPKRAIVVLGAPNDAQGVLSSIAEERCEQALLEYKRLVGSKVLPTGGWGAHFNTTENPHGYYLAKYLTARGIPETDILEVAESSNTIEDAAFCRPIVERHGLTELVIVTSDFHLARAKFLFETEFSGIKTSFSGSKTHLPKEELARRQAHEERALSRLKARSRE